jgi:formylglycine-generating enzyme required for sulfatase activity
VRLVSRGAGEREELAPRELLRALGGAVGEESADETDERRRAGVGRLHMLGPRWGAVMARVAAGSVGVGVIAAAWTPGNSSGSERFRETRGNPAAAREMSGLVEVQGDSVVKTKKFGSDVMLGAAAAVSMTAGALAGDAVQWRVEDGGNGHWYRLVINAPITWPNARTACESVGGHLVTPTTPAENQFLLSIANRAANPEAWVNDFGGNAVGPWLGGFQPAEASPNQPWAWVTGESWSWTGWAPGEPNGGFAPGISVTAMLGYANSSYFRGWADAGLIDFPPYPLPPSYVVEWSADCNSDGIVDYGQILAGQLADANSNGIPDICECATHPELGACRCAGDIVADGTVNGADLGTLLAYWGPRTSGSFSIASDINSDGHIDGSDLGVLLANWGTCTPAGPTAPAWATLIEAFPDPAVVTDHELRMAIAATGLAWRVRDTGTGIEMLLVPPGTFQMGCSASAQSACNPMELPVHPVTLTDAFYLGRFEVTQAQWQSRMGSNPSYFQGYPDSPSRPVDGVSWNMSQAFNSATSMRLPTEAEWEYACRAGTTTAFFNGSNDDSTVVEIAWCGANSGGQSHAVGQQKANRLGFHDIVGNVWEWTNDWYADYNAATQSNPQGPTNGPGKVLRGSTWFAESPSEFRSSYRGYESPNFADQWRGFRAARNP